MREVLKHWQLEDVSYTKLTDTAWRLDDTSVLKRYTNPYHMKTNIEIMKALKESEVPVPAIINTVNGDSFCEYEEIYYVLSERLEGSHLAVADVITDEQTGKGLGEVVARLHRGLKLTEDDYDFERNDLIQDLKGWIRNTISTAGKNYYAYDIIDYCIDKMARVYPSLPRQPIHRDVHLSNMVFNDGKLIGYIDFDISQINARIFDLAYMAVGSLAEIIDEIPLQMKWVDFVTVFMKGYEAVNPLTEIEKESLFLMMACIELLYVAYFLNMGDGEKAILADRILRWLMASGKI